MTHLKLSRTEFMRILWSIQRSPITPIDIGAIPEFTPEELMVPKWEESFATYFDSWYASPKYIQGVNERNLFVKKHVENVLAACKENEKTLQVEP